VHWTPQKTEVEVEVEVDDLEEVVETSLGPPAT
jgi:hypothetical protein